MYRLGFFSFVGSDPSSKVVAAAIAAVGVLFSASVAFVGVLVKLALDERTERRLEADAERNHILQREAEQRLKLEAAIRATQLLSTSDGKLSPPMQRAAALQTLSSLGQHEVTMSLAGSLLRDSHLAAESAVKLLNAALMSGDLQAQRDAMSLLYYEAGRFLVPGGVEYPFCFVDGSERNFPRDVRSWVPLVLGKMIVGRPVEEWRPLRAYLAGIMGILAFIWEHELDPHIKGNAAAILHRALRAFPDIHNVFHAGTKLDLDAIRKRVDAALGQTELGRDLVAELDTWAQSGERGPTLV